MRAQSGGEGEGGDVPLGPKPWPRELGAAPTAQAVRVRRRLCFVWVRACAITLALAAGLFADLDSNPGAGGPVQRAQAQQRASIAVARTTQAEASSRTRLQIQISPPDAIAKNSFVRIRGLPPAVALSEGHSIAPGAWAVPLVALPNLTLILPVGQQGPAEVAISLVSIEGTVLAETKTTLVVIAARGNDDPAASAAPRAPVPKLTQEQRERALGLHAKGLEQLERGNVYAARKFFELAADIGLAPSAVAAAGTYDPDELAKLRVVGFQPDVEAARKWYERARELGAVEAAERLRRLGSR
jgi:transcriptional regulator with XRE-family HTH domain